MRTNYSAYASGKTSSSSSSSSSSFSSKKSASDIARSLRQAANDVISIEAEADTKKHELLQERRRCTDLRLKLEEARKLLEDSQSELSRADQKNDSFKAEIGLYKREVVALRLEVAAARAAQAAMKDVSADKDDASSVDSTCSWWCTDDMTEPLTRDAFLLAARRGKTQQLRDALDPDCCRSATLALVLGDALQECCKGGAKNLATAEMLLREGAVLNTSRRSRRRTGSALHSAVTARSEEMAELLLNAARTPAQGSEAKTSAWNTSGFGSRGSAEAQLAIVDALNAQGRTPLHLASKIKHAGLCRLLLRAGASCRKRDERMRKTAEQLALDTNIHVPWGTTEGMRVVFGESRLRFWNCSKRANLLYRCARYRKAQRCYAGALELGEGMHTRREISSADLVTLFLNHAKSALRCPASRHGCARRSCGRALEWLGKAQAERSGLFSRDDDERKAMDGKIRYVRAQCHVAAFNYAAAITDFSAAIAVFAPGGVAPNATSCAECRKLLAEARRCHGASHYAVLGIKTRATGAEIKRAFRRASLRWHPDKFRRNELVAEETTRKAKRDKRTKKKKKKKKGGSSSLGVDGLNDDDEDEDDGLGMSSSSSSSSSDEEEEGEEEDPDGLLEARGEHLRLRATNHFRRIQDARTTLLDSGRRHAYDSVRRRSRPSSSSSSSSSRFPKSWRTNWGRGSGFGGSDDSEEDESDDESGSGEEEYPWIDAEERAKAREAEIRARQVAAERRAREAREKAEAEWRRLEAQRQQRLDAAAKVKEDERRAMESMFKAAEDQIRTSAAERARRRAEDDLLAQVEGEDVDAWRDDDFNSDDSFDPVKTGPGAAPVDEPPPPFDAAAAAAAATSSGTRAGGDSNNTTTSTSTTSTTTSTSSGSSNKKMFSGFRGGFFSKKSKKKKGRKKKAAAKTRAAKAKAKKAKAAPSPAPAPAPVPAADTESKTTSSSPAEGDGGDGGGDVTSPTSAFPPRPPTTSFPTASVSPGKEQRRFLRVRRPGKATVPASGAGSSSSSSNYNNSNKGAGEYKGGSSSVGFDFSAAATATATATSTSQSTGFMFPKPDAQAETGTGTGTGTKPSSKEEHEANIDWMSAKIEEHKRRQQQRGEPGRAAAPPPPPPPTSTSTSTSTWGPHRGGSGASDSSDESFASESEEEEEEEEGEIIEDENEDQGNVGIEEDILGDLLSRLDAAGITGDGDEDGPSLLELQAQRRAARDALCALNKLKSDCTHDRANKANELSQEVMDALDELQAGAHTASRDDDDDAGTKAASDDDGDGGALRTAAAEKVDKVSAAGSAEEGARRGGGAVSPSWFSA